MYSKEFIKTFDPSKRWTASWSFVQRFRIWSTNLFALESFFSPPFWDLHHLCYLQIAYFNCYEGKTVPIVVVNPVDFARYFPWRIGIRYIGFSNLKTYIVLPTPGHMRSLERSFTRSNFVSPSLIMTVYPWFQAIEKILIELKRFCFTFD